MAPVENSSTDVAAGVVEEDRLVQVWCAEQLQLLGLSSTLAERFAGRVDWHEIATLVARGCSPEVALEIVR
jgi:hypothetical protein